MCALTLCSLNTELSILTGLLTRNAEPRNPMSVVDVARMKKEWYLMVKVMVFVMGCFAFVVEVVQDR